MMTTENGTLPIILKALLGAWVTLIFGTAVLIYFFTTLPHQTYHANPIINSLRNIWEIADAMGPAVKLSLIAMFAALVLIFKNIITQNQALLYAGSMLMAIVAVVVVLALLPANFSRGYGIGLTSARFDANLMPIYLLGAIMGGTAFAIIYTRLAKSR